MHSERSGVTRHVGQSIREVYEKAPVAVMVRGVLERVLNPGALDALYERAAVKQYTRELLFSNVVLISNEFQPSESSALGAGR